MSMKQKARKVQEATGLAYTTCLRLVRGETRLEPQSPDCTIRAALLAAGASLQSDGAKPCKCPRCTPEPDDPA
jgi:hypothetical protein